MNGRDWTRASDAEFENMLENALPPVPPDDITREVTPFRKASRRIFLGLGLSMVTLNFWNIDTIQTCIGMVLMLLGLRVLRRENGALRAAFALACLRAAILFPLVAAGAYVLPEKAAQSALWDVLSAVNLGLLLAMLLCLRSALRTMRRRAGLPAAVPGTVAVIVWYVLLLVMALASYTGFAVWGMLIAWVFIIRSLLKASRQLDEAGYTAVPAPVRVSDARAVLLLTAALGLCMAVGYAFFVRYPMQWSQVSAPSAQAEPVRDELAQMGFPERVLGDLTDEEVLQCQNARRIEVEVNEHNVSGLGYGAQPGEPEVRITGIAVQLDTERETWRIFHHFEWLKDPGFWGTECIQLWPSFRQGMDGWGDGGQLGGRVLYEKDGKTYASSYAWLGTKTYRSSSIFWGETTSSDIFAAFSLPPQAESRRGYVCYTIKEMEDGWIIDSWFNYTHQHSRWQYPAKSALAHRMQNSMNLGGAFYTVQDALQFYPGDLE